MRSHDPVSHRSTNRHLAISPSSLLFRPREVFIVDCLWDLPGTVAIRSRWSWTDCDTERVSSVFSILLPISSTSTIATFALFPPAIVSKIRDHMPGLRPIPCPHYGIFLEFLSREKNEHLHCSLTRVEFCIHTPGPIVFMRLLAWVLLDYCMPYPKTNFGYTENATRRTSPWPRHTNYIIVKEERHDFWLRSPVIQKYKWPKVLPLSWHASCHCLPIIGVIRTRDAVLSCFEVNP